LLYCALDQLSDSVPFGFAPQRLNFGVGQADLALVRSSDA